MSFLGLRKEILVDTLLLVSSDLSLVQELSFQLKDEYNFVIASDRNSIAELLKDKSIKLVIIDMDYDDEQDSFSVLGQIKKQEATLPILMLTSEGDVIRVIKAIRLGADDYILKSTSDIYKTLKLRIKVALNEDKVDIFNNHRKMRDNVFSLGYDDYVKHVEKLVLEHLETDEKMINSSKS